tara:strand:- start:429 stop:767 length:339 start_codon:yes stop_codon:yes gene_type:complete
MRLYKSTNGQWVGTQRDAQRNFPRNWEEVNVPVDKDGLLGFLNTNQVATKTTTEIKPAIPVEDMPELLSPQASSWVKWAYETLRRGDKKEAETMLLNGLEVQHKLEKGVSNG